MSTDFWAGYISGVAGIIIGNPLDVIKVRLQAGHAADGKWMGAPEGQVRGSEGWRAWSRGAPAPILGYGALNALLFVAYNRSLLLLDPPSLDFPQATSLLNIWTAGVVGGLATWVASAPTELIKCRTQLGGEGVSSWTTAKEVWRSGGLRALYYGGAVTSIRDAVGYGFYFWSYELCKRYTSFGDDSKRQAAVKVLLCGGVAGVVTWASIFPLDVIKTRLQAQGCGDKASECRPLLPGSQEGLREKQKGTMEIARQAYRQEGMGVFFRGLGVCSVRAFIVNAVQWAVYEWTVQRLKI